MIPTDTANGSALAQVLRATGLALRRHPRRIAALQGLMVAVYAAVVLTPVLLPDTGPARLAQFLNWGLWWPLAILSVLLAGRLWCGLLCPEGALTEWVSQRGLGRPIPAWVRWGGWPSAGLLAVTLYGQLADIYANPPAAALLLGGSTATAMLVGLLYGRGKRVWCRYLCPVTGVFGLLARLAPLAFRVDRAAWEQAPRGRRASGSGQVNCAPLLNIRRMESVSDCNMCGRCAGERDAVQLAARSPHAEILRGDAELWPARLLLFGLLGLAPATFLWPLSPWSTLLRQDSALLAGLLAAATLLGGGWLWLWLRWAARLTGRHWPVLAMALLPVAGLQLLAGFSYIGSGQLATAGLVLPWADVLRGGTLGAGFIWSLWLAWRLGSRAAVACLAAGLAPSFAAWCWALAA